MEQAKQNQANMAMNMNMPMGRFGQYDGRGQALMYNSMQSAGMP